ncbi:MAG: sulfotransferase family protein [Candidatus Poribacteria bacterium]|nr:sulfotransferase family protein [Candidatus Poribacteria bacterium]
MTQTDIVQAEASTDDDDAFITVVSGLPRSGTSLMMQMLHAGGHPCLTDAIREADADNPRGYFEFERVKRLRTNRSWLPKAKGRAVKIIAQLLPFLPTELNYRIVFMERALDEVIASQNKMLERQDRSGGALSDERLREVFARQLRQIKNRLATQKIPTLYVAYQDTLKRPMDVASQLKAFLSESLNEQAMARAVDRDLYRQRRTQPDAEKF